MTGVQTCALPISLKSKNEFYTFKLSDHERIFIKRLDDNKIFYNNFIYDKDFFFYEQLIKLIIHINKCRDDFIKESFKRYIDYNIYSNAKGIRLLKVISFSLDYNNECQNLTKEQYDILVKAYNYEFYYEHLYDFFHPWKEIPRATHLKDLLEDWLYINGWKSIKPVYPIFQPALYKYYNSNRKDKVYFSEPTLKDPAVKYGFTMMPNPNYLNKDNCSLAWDEELKFHRTFNWSEEFHKYENSKENKEFSFITEESTKVFDVYNPVYNPLNEGTDIREEWLDYDEKKKI